MGYFIITDKQWAMLRDEILALAQTCHKAFGESSKHTDWLHNGDVCRLLNISKRTLQHYRDTACFRLHKSDTSAITSVNTWNGCYRQNQRKPRATNRQTMKRWKQLEI